MDMLSSLEAFITIVEEGGFAPAGRKLALATSSVTRQIDALEKFLGTRLLTRSTRNVVLTEAGHVYFEHAVRIINDLEYANQEVRDQTGEPSGVLRLSLPVSFSRLHIAPMLTNFSTRYPLITLDLTFTDDIVDIIEKRQDMAIRIGKPSAPNMVARKLIPQKRYVCASPDYLDKHGVPLNPQDLEKHNCLVFSYSSGNTKWYFKSDTQIAINVKGSLKCNNADILRETVLNGYGIAVLSDWMIDKDIKAGNLIKLLPEYQCDVSENAGDSAIYAVYPTTHRSTKKMNVFLDFLKEHLTSESEE